MAQKGTSETMEILHNDTQDIAQVCVNGVSSQDKFTTGLHAAQNSSHGALWWL